MKNFSIQNIIEDKFNIFIEDYHETIKMNIKGIIDIDNAHDVLTPYFTRIHEKIIANNLKLVYIDITELDFINSSSIRTILNWIIMIKALKNDKIYKINFILDLEKKWQKSSFLVIFNLYADIIDFNF